MKMRVNKVLSGIVAGILAIAMSAPVLATDYAAPARVEVRYDDYQLEQEVRKVVVKQRQKVRRVKVVEVYVDQYGRVCEKASRQPLRDAFGRAIRQRFAVRQFVQVRGSRLVRARLGVGANARDIFLEAAVARELQQGNVGRALLIDRLFR
jgi:hypothetical protein